MRAFLIGLIAVTAACVSVAAAAGGRAASEVEMTDFSVSDGDAIFKGRVTSPAAKCAGKGRKVKVVGYNTGEPKRTFGTDRTNAAGKFTVREPIPFSGNFAYAKVKATKHCKADRSEPISTAG